MTGPTATARRTRKHPALQTPKALPFAAQRTEFVIAGLGKTGASKLADLLNVARSQPTRWRTGKETPGPQTARLLLDLDYVLARLLLLYPPTVATTWLTSGNGFLDGSRPIDVLRIRGSRDVVDAIDATMAGAFA